jgi:hypothetical protein
MKNETVADKNDNEFRNFITEIRSYDIEAWNSLDSTSASKFSKTQQDEIYRIKNNFFTKYYAANPDSEETDDQPQNEFTSPEVQSAFNQHIAKLEAQRAEYMAKENPSFVMYHSFYEALGDLHGVDFETHMRALCERGLYKKTDIYNGSVKMFMTQAIPQLEANERKKIAARLNGMKGGGQNDNKNAKKR